MVLCSRSCCSTMFLFSLLVTVICIQLFESAFHMKEACKPSQSNRETVSSTRFHLQIRRYADWREQLKLAILAHTVLSFLFASQIRQNYSIVHSAHLKQANSMVPGFRWKWNGLSGNCTMLAKFNDNKSCSNRVRVHLYWCDLEHCAAA